MTVRFMDAYETAENIERYFEQMKTSCKNWARGEACRCMGYDVSHVLQAAEEVKSGVKLLAGSSEHLIA